MNSINAKILDNTLNEWYEYGKNNTSRFYESKSYTMPKVVRANSVYGHSILEYTIFGSIEYNFPLIKDFVIFLEFEKNSMYNSQIIHYGPNTNLFTTRYLAYMDLFKSTGLYDLKRKHCIKELLMEDYNSTNKEFKEDGFFDLFQLLYLGEMCEEQILILDGAHGCRLVTNDLEKIHKINFSKFLVSKRILNNMFLHGSNKYGNEMFFYAPKDMKYKYTIPYLLYKRHISNYKKELSNIIGVLISEIQNIEAIKRMKE